jgi:hypothetical protein
MTSPPSASELHPEACEISHSHTLSESAKAGQSAGSGVPGVLIGLLLRTLPLDVMAAAAPSSAAIDNTLIAAPIAGGRIECIQNKDSKI